MNAIAFLDEVDINIFEAAVVSYNEEVIRLLDYHLM